MQNYRQGDKICLFGFSRGAYTGRALAGFLFKIGLLPRDNEEQIPFAYRLYKRTDEAGSRIAAGYKQTFCTPVTIDFVGVWDTVASVGILYGRNLPFTTGNEAVRVFRHTLSLDEHRARFQPNMFHRECSDEESARKDPEYASRANTLDLPSPGGVGIQHSRPKMTTWKIDVQRLSEVERHKTVGRRNDISSRSRVFARERSALRKTEVGLLQSVEEFWFTGCHSDVGGGAVTDDRRNSLADISLRWMVKQVVLSQCGILFDHAALRRADIGISTIVFTDSHQPTVGDFWKKESQVPKGSPTASLHENGNHAGGPAAAETWPTDHDVLTDSHDRLKTQRVWRTLQLFPMKYAWQEANGTWNAKWGFNSREGETASRRGTILPYLHKREDARRRVELSTKGQVESR